MGRHTTRGRGAEYAEVRQAVDLKKRDRHNPAFLQMSHAEMLQGATALQPLIRFDTVQAKFPKGLLLRSVFFADGMTHAEMWGIYNIHIILYDCVHIYIYIYHNNNHNNNNDNKTKNNKSIT